MPRSLHTRLVLFFSVGTALITLACLLLLHAALDHELDGAVSADLSGRRDDLVAAVRAGDRRAVDDDPLAQLYAADGSVLAGSRGLHGQRLLSVAQVAAVSRPRTQVLLLPLDPGGTLVEVRLLAAPVRRGTTAGQVLAVAVRTEVFDAAGGRQLTVLMLAAPLLIAALAVAGWAIVRAALRPVDLLSREAAAISSLDNGRRLPAVKGDDEIARLAATLDRMLQRLRVAFARERAFVDDASHELRTPLAVLRGEIELAADSLAGVSRAVAEGRPPTDDLAEVRQSLEAAKAQVVRLTRLADDLLLLAREGSGTLVAMQQPVDVADLVRDLGPALGLRVTISDETAVIAADPDRLRQVFVNLAANSAAAAATQVRLDVRTEAAEVRLEWADDGRGFPPGLLTSAFERFVRGDPARTGESGAGLGLSIVRAIVVAHAGSVELRNGPPLGGAVVTVRLPAAS